MAESRLDLDRLPGEVKTPQDESHLTLTMDDQVDSGDGEEYSSGSDRSLEADDVDNNRSGYAGTGNNLANVDEYARNQRKGRNGSHGSRRQKGGIRHKHKGFQPYPPKDQMKRKSMEIKEKENAAAVMRRENGEQEFVKFPAAPFNSTQFIMDEHNVASPAGTQKVPSSSKLDSTSPYMSSSVLTTPIEINSDTSNWEKKDNKEFVEIYTSLHAESLQSLPKEELVKHYMNLEEQVALLQKKVAEQQSKGESVSKPDGEEDKESMCYSASISDTNSLSSANEEFVDLATVDQPTIYVGENVESSKKVGDNFQKPTTGIAF